MQLGSGSEPPLLELGFERAPTALAILRGPGFAIDAINDAALELWGGIDRAAALGRPLLEACPALARAELGELLEAARGEGRRVVGRERAVVWTAARDADVEPDAEPARVTRYADFACAPLHGAGAPCEHVILSASDITETVRFRLDVTEEADAAVRAQLQLADQRKDEYLATLAHELRNPMAAIRTALALIEGSGREPDKLARYVATAKRQMNNLVRMVDDLLDVARIDRGTIELRREEADLAVIVEDAVGAARPAIEARGHVLELALEPGSYRIAADATRIEQIVANLLSNAARYTERGGRITVRLRREGEAGAPFAELSVRDTGRGIPPSMLRTVFEPFTQVSPSIDRSTGGLGLGLTLVRRLAELHGGSAEARSDGLGLGSTFVVRLPLLPDAPARTARSASTPPPAGSTRRVLLVDDSEDSREMLRELLEGFSHEVLSAEDGLQGVERALEHRPDVALIDIGLPGIDGFEVARRIREAPEGARPLLIAVTGYGSAEVKAKAQAAGFDLHLTKPVDLKKLLELIQAHGRPRSG